VEQGTLTCGTSKHGELPDKELPEKEVPDKELPDKLADSQAFTYLEQAAKPLPHLHVYLIYTHLMQLS